ncbi:hypothetical protein BESB_017230 [Besnoitia besnoiti]|uniref:Uncharacterized protein n=1 Tax=Besnoitia besnoiti TaxID=94643 RepID=A0A2A9M369_BESBE|nr:hypothetical protein BESB_017230 [Besnoitia besnoiti]PFH32405.1 hypothetical protein BESB_017230 [Besnoitia besnoiti]
MRVAFTIFSTDYLISGGSDSGSEATNLGRSSEAEAGLCGDVEWAVLDGHGDSRGAQGSPWPPCSRREDLLTAHRDGRIRLWPDGDCSACAPETLVSLRGAAVSCFASASGSRHHASGLTGHRTEDPCIVIGTEDGSLRVFSQPGRGREWVEQACVQEAHAAPVTFVVWSPDNSHFVSTGDDGKARLWSRRCQPKPSEETCEAPVAAVRWSDEGDAVVLAFGQKLRLATFSRSAATTRSKTRSRHGRREWRAHDGGVLAVDWSGTLILSGGEEGTYKIWNDAGALLFTGSAPPTRPPDKPSDSALLSPVTAVRWSPLAETFAVAASEWVAVCDKSGSLLAQFFKEFGQPHSLAWNRNGTRLAVAGTPSSLAIGYVAGEPSRWNHFEVSEESETRLVLRASRPLELRDPIVQWSIGFGALMLVTSRQCYVCKLSAAPSLEDCEAAYIDDLQQPCRFLKQGARHACAVQPSHIQVDRGSPRVVRVFEVLSGAAAHSLTSHSLDIKEIRLSQQEDTQRRKLAILDVAGNILISSLQSPRWVRLTTQPVHSFAWEELSDALATVSQATVTCFLYPEGAFFSPEFLEESQITKDLGDENSGSRIVGFRNGHLCLRRRDGATLHVVAAPFVGAIYEQVAQLRWDGAVRLCRLIKSTALWGCLAAMALSQNLAVLYPPLPPLASTLSPENRELEVAEIACAALGNIATVQQIQRIQKIRHPTRKAAETALVCHKPDDAVHVLVEQGMVYRALEILMEVHRWEDALALATACKTHVDTVVAHRKKFLEGFNLRETKPKFEAAFAATQIDWLAIQARIRQDVEKEENAAVAGC